MLKLSCLLATAFALAAGAGSAAAQSSAAFVGVHVIPMDEERILRDQTVVVEDGRITEVGAANAVSPPDGAAVIEGGRRYLMPGLAEMHGHIASGDDAEDVLFLYVAGGVTTVRGMLGNEAQFDLRERVNAGEIIGPALYLASPPISGNNTPDAETGREKVRQYKAAGYDLLKVHEGLSKDTYEAVAAEANALNIDFAGHVADDVGLARALALGQRTIDHLDNYISFMSAENSPATEEMLARAVSATLDARAGVAPTMALWEHFSGVGPDIADFDELRYVAKDTRESWARRYAQSVAEYNENPELGDIIVENRRKVLKALSDSGAEILLASDAPQYLSVPGFSIHNEMASMAAAGMTPYAILRAGTAAAGAYFAEKDRFGTIAPGARADMVLLGANPLDDIANAKQIAGVMAGGRWIPKAEIDDRLKAVAQKHAD